jgi:hypothetical protein
MIKKKRSQSRVNAKTGNEHMTAPMKSEDDRTE